MKVPEFKIGDIVSSNITNHPIVYIDSYFDDFIGCLITHSTTDEYSDNIGLRKSDFIIEEGFSVIYDDSYFVSKKTIKKAEWGPFEKVGQISKYGIKLIKSYIKNKESQLWKSK